MLVDVFKKSIEYILTTPLLFLLAGGIILTCKTRFVQIRTIPLMLRLLWQSITHKQKTTEYTIRAHRALFTAMATSLGIGNILAPVVAIGFGGPGALLGFMLATLFGTATAFAEVTFALSYRKKLHNGKIMGGPMQYLKEVNPILAILYGIFGSMMLIHWSGKQTNTLATMLKAYSIPTYVTGILTAILVAIILTQGIKLIGNIAEKIIPFIFFLYSGAMLYIIIIHIHNLPLAFKLIFQSAFTPKALMGAGVGLGIQKALQFGLSEAAFANEAGVGTAAIPHSMAATKNSLNQGILSMISVYTNGFLCMLSGLAILVSGAWITPGRSFDITMLATLFKEHFSLIGPLLLLLTVLLFAFTSIIGNSYNGSQCFLFVTKNRLLRWYYALIAIFVFVSAIIDVKTLWSLSAYFIVPVAVPNIIGIVVLAFKRKDLLKNSLS